MKLQFKTDDLLKKVEGLIMKDIAARKEHNRKVDEYIAEKTAQRESDIEKAKTILSKYSDAELKEMFLEKHVITREGVFFNHKRETLREVESVTIDGVEFGTTSHECFEELRPLKYRACFKKYLADDEYYYEDILFSPIPKNLTKIPKVLLPWEITETPSKELVALKDNCLQAKSYSIEFCTLDDKDLKVLNKCPSDDYTTRIDIHRLIYRSGNTLPWTDVIDTKDLL